MKRLIQLITVAAALAVMGVTAFAGPGDIGTGTPITAVAPAATP